MNRRPRPERLLSILSPLVLLALWEILAQIEWLDTRFFPPPSDVIVALWDMVLTGELWRHLYASMYRLLWGFVFGAVPGLVLGLAMGLSRWVRAVLDPLVAATYPIPKSALLPLLLLIFGLGETSKIALIVAGVFFPVIINTLSGVLQINKIYFDVGRNFQADLKRVVRTIAIPGALPTIIAGLRLGAGLALILVYVAEMVGAESGIGYMMWNAWTLFAVERMYVGLLVIGILGYLLSLMFDGAERRLVPWKAAH